MNGSDSVTITFEGPRAPDTMTDCLGNPIDSPATGVVTPCRNRFFVAVIRSQPDNTVWPVITLATGTIPLPMPLLGGVENMQIRYGQVFSNTNNRTYVPLNMVTDMRQVESIQIRLLMRSADEINSHHNLIALITTVMALMK
ncbi:MAG: PilW family protein [Candidatus Competibacteraceae bacterium]|nr:PilW family protein [Candidatus Competibacteraceae bacterium]